MRPHASSRASVRWAGMERVWFVSNVHSHTATHEKCEAIEAVFAERGLHLAGRTRFPDDPLPDAATLAEADADTLVLFAGDGTINAALCRLADWNGAFLILPGGTMNLLAKALHPALDPGEIIHAAHRESRRTTLPFVEAGPHRAYVGVILGPAASWFRAREAVRHGRLVQLARAVGLAWRRSFGRGVRVEGAPRLPRGYQAIFLSPAADGVSAAAVNARDWLSIAALGWSFLTGDWVDARAVDTASPDRLRVLGRRPVLALFDGEPEMLDPGTIVTGGLSRAMFLTTRAD